MRAMILAAGRGERRRRAGQSRGPQGPRGRLQRHRRGGSEGTYGADGGGRSTGGRVQLEGTIGQNAVGDPATGGLYELIPGFRREHGPVVDGVFADGFEGD